MRSETTVHELDSAGRYGHPRRRQIHLLHPVEGQAAFAGPLLAER